MGSGKYEYRLPRKGDRVQFMVADYWGRRDVVKATVLRKKNGWIDYVLDEDEEGPGIVRCMKAHEMGIIGRTSLPANQKLNPQKDQENTMKKLTTFKASFKFRSSEDPYHLFEAVDQVFQDFIENAAQNHDIEICPEEHCEGPTVEPVKGEQ